MKSIGTKIIAGVLLITLLGTFVLITYNYWNTRQILLDQLYTQQMNSIHANSEKMDSWLKDKIDLIYTICYSDLVIHPEQEKTTAYFHKITEDNPDFFTIYIGLNDGSYIDGNGYVPDEKYDPRKRDWYIKAEQEGKPTITDPYIDDETKKLVISVANPFYDSQGKLLGVVVGDLMLDKLVEYTSGIKSGKSGAAFVLINDGKVLTHPQTELVMKANFLEDSDRGLQAIAQDMVQGKESYQEYYEDGLEKLAVYSPIQSGNWSLALTIPVSEATSELDGLIWKYVILGLLNMLVIAVVLYFFIGHLIKSLKSLTQGSIALADGDLTKRVELKKKSQDEIGHLARVFNNMADNLNLIIKQVLDSSKQMVVSSQELTASSEQSTQAANQVADAVTTTAQMAERQSESVEKALTIVEEMSGSLQQVADNARTVADFSRKSAGTADEGSIAVKKAVEQMEHIEETVRSLAQIINKLGIRSNEIGQIIDTIAEIAEQTNLLALNAAIEAASAGEHGRGFAVVADEVRKLAEQSQAATKNITSLINEIQTDTEQAVTAMEQGTEEVVKGTEVVNTAGNTLEDISNLVKEVVTLTEEGTQAVEQIAANSQNIVTAVEEIDEMSKNISTETQMVSAASEEQLATMEEIAGSSESMNKMAEDLETAVSKFKV